MQHLEGSGTPVLYIGRTVLKGSKQHSTGPSKEPNEFSAHPDTLVSY